MPKLSYQCPKYRRFKGEIWRSFCCAARKSTWANGDRPSPSSCTTSYCRPGCKRPGADRRSVAHGGHCLARRSPGSAADRPATGRQVQRIRPAVLSQARAGDCARRADRRIAPDRLRVVWRYTGRAVRPGAFETGPAGDDRQGLVAKVHQQAGGSDPPGVCLGGRGRAARPDGKYRALAKFRSLAKDRSAARETPPVQCVPDSEVTRRCRSCPRSYADMVRSAAQYRHAPQRSLRHHARRRGSHSRVWLYTVEGHKMAHTGSERVVPIGPRGQAVLGKYLLREADQPCFSPREAERQRRAALHAQRKTPASCGNRPDRNCQEQPRRRQVMRTQRPATAEHCEGLRQGRH